MLSLLLAAFTVQKNNSAELIQLVVTIPQLTTINLQKDLETDFSRINGVHFCETSLMTKTLMLNYDPRKLELSDIKYVLQKWECIPDEFSYMKISEEDIFE